MGIKTQTDEAKLLIDALIDKKMQEYSEIDRMIVSYQVDFKRDELLLNVASTIFPEEIEK